MGISTTGYIDYATYTPISPKGYIAMCKEYRMRIRAYYDGPFPPTYYARIGSAIDNRALGYLLYDVGRSEWVYIDDRYITPLLEGLFV